eukprot:gene2274-23113_t
MSANPTLAEMNFYRTERPILIAQGIAIQTLLPQGASVHEVLFSAPLSASEMRDYGLVLRRVDTEAAANIKYMYVAVQDVTAPPPAIGGKRKASGECSAAPVAKQRANLFDKLVLGLKKDTLQNICEDLGVAVSGNKDELISRIAETLR